MSDTPLQKAAPKRGISKILPVVVLVVAVGGAAGGFYWGRASADGPQAETRVEQPAGTAIIPMDPFVVNLADREAPRFLRVTLRLVVDQAKDAQRVEKDPVLLARTRSTILELLTTKRAEAITTPEGKQALKQAVAEQASAVLRLEIRDVLFTDFVVQF